MACIVVDGHVRIVDAINTIEFSRSAIIRAVSAIESGRAVGKPGRPELFSEENKNIFVGVIKIENKSSLRLSDSFKTLVIHPSGVPAGFHTTPTNKPNATFVDPPAADGYSLKSVVLWPCHKLPKEMRVLLSAFIDPDIWQKSADNIIDVVTFIPHSSRITQPLDRGVFPVFKKYINSLYSVPPDSSISLRREAISNVLPQALQTALFPATVVSLFAKSGVLSNEWHSVLSTLPNEPSVKLKKRTHRKIVKRELVDYIYE
ncbi:uncharacterized protein MONOS_1415 [Monocercomonoides exilis]|uniref:uncharacterized protein n=1 Tax=Monocercomonoides exilis TaxID=2049356 RepID=UPI0035594D26|nr:hypothetical protein MONOS_1415 [Monocercomonoides exilis]|eukprot:MONOS_1415.1-p1 / transcript=MONOS_1415.1 / gene=MONOS_1415 / organism=Monocercomonoides_exilis_PA203 / gene_product=unspecified product / transcript_product=unspecified product / location=Mono_scaffold00025:1466-2962(-) / protein_length=260 / sequence_SO=supercontig / SO=protein_coding / is_pseudo=false